MKRTLYFFLIILLNFPAVSFSSCAPIPPESTKWLMMTATFEQKKIPSSITITLDESIHRFSIRKTNPEDSVVIHTVHGRRAEVKKYGTTMGYSALSKTFPKTGYFPSLDIPPSPIVIPPDQNFELIIEINKQRIVIPGKLIFRKNPDFDPEAAGKAQQQCY